MTIKTVLQASLGALGLSALAMSMAVTGSEPVAIDRDEVVLQGSLLAAEPGGPLIILHPGSGPTDRYGNQPGMNNNALGLLADALHQQGYSVLRYDKRGVGESHSAQAESELRPGHFIADLVAWVDWAEARTPGQGVVLMGHSEGGLFAKAAGLERPQTVIGVVALAAAGRPVGELLLEQTEGRRPGDLDGQFRSILAELEAGRTVDTVPPLLAALFRPSVQPYLIDWLAMEPQAMAAALAPPLLVVGGSSDLQVGRADFDALAMLAEQSAWLEGMNHVLKASEGPIEQQLPSYLTPDGPLHPALLPALDAFLGGLTAER
ncbi:MAG: alpha/beta hydrolase [Wenzhouxiangella sp.]